MEYRIEKLSDQNIQDLIPIYKNAVNDEIDPLLLKNKFDTEFTGFKNVGYIAYSPKNEPAAFYGVLPCFLNYEGEKILIAQSGNTMTHKKHRRKNLFVILAEKTFEYCRENNIKLVYGFPNEFSYLSFVKKLGWTHDENIQTYITKTTCIPLIRFQSIAKLSDAILLKHAHKIL